MHNNRASWEQRKGHSAYLWKDQRKHIYKTKLSILHFIINILLLNVSLQLLFLNYTL